MKMPKVSVIIPIYNVEQWIERCAHSLFGQTMEDLEYIFIDDCIWSTFLLMIVRPMTVWQYYCEYWNLTLIENTK